ncbi:Uncharacterised protein [Mycoplasmopsis californica]|uniref:DUF6088 family protein n=1 Tax=Mycoplasmopsis equigenitalium TaxID=114883 RepID=A0ABY5J0C0_9BACT|nr:DUF6088 family protein [Mycoplasmopsis equigenitalium]UUD36703.1 DUF6088 family protein [Mycoplasmopsis equigenitalium]VEU70004.1 Uncharacterised protein [Mycoplasmopsis californica]
MESIKSMILDRILSKKECETFIASDFFDIANYDTVRKTLNRLVIEKSIKRAINGIYYHSKYNDFLEIEPKPSTRDIAYTLARKYNWTIAPSGNASLNLLDLSTQVPAKWIYVSDGRNAEFQYKNAKIKFLHRKRSNVNSNMSEISLLLIQAIDKLGENNVRDWQINHLKRFVNRSNRKKILDETKNTSRWIYEVIKRICMEEE